MRLGQLAKKHDIPVKEIISYLENETGEKFHPNAKLYDALESKVFEHFELMPETIPVEDKSEPAANENESDVETEIIADDKISVEAKTLLPATPEEEIAALDGELAQREELPSLDVELDKNEKDHKVEPAADEVIQTDRLLELLESEEPSADLDKIKLIKAPKKELSGLKVVGKVDLPAPKEKKEKHSEVITEKDLKEYRNPRKKRQPLSEEEKEKRRLKAKRKKEAYEARQEKRRKEREEQERKARKEEHYKQKLEQAKAIQQKRRPKLETPVAPELNEKTRPEPKTLLGKFWRWMNT